jgi:hypothetical protein
MSQLLTTFQSVFSTDAVKIDFSEFAKDGAFSADVIKALKAEGLDAIYLKPLTSFERVELETSVAGIDGKARDMHNLYAKFVAPCWVDGEDGKPIGTAKQIGQLRSDLVTEIFNKVREMNGMTDVEEAGKD